MVFYVLSFTPSHTISTMSEVKGYKATKCLKTCKVAGRKELKPFEKL